MNDKQVSTEIKNAGRLNTILENTEPISKDSKATKKFYEIRAIESGGLDVEIVGVNSRLEYKERATIHERSKFPISIYMVEDSKITNLENADFSFIQESYNDEDYDCEFHHQCVLFEPVIDVYFRTPFNEIYVENINISKTGTIVDTQETENFLNEINKEIRRKENLDSINDLRPMRTIDAKLRPDSDLTDGKLEINDIQISINAKQVDNVKLSNDNTNVFNYIRNKNVAFEDQYNMYNSSLRDWYWGHISDLRYENDDNNILLVVKTPIHKTVFKFNLNHDTDTGVWKFVNHNGGSIEDLRGMDVCVRERAGCLKMFKKDDLRTSSSKNNIGSVVSNQPIESLNRWNRTQIVDSKSPVEPVGVDVNRVWDVGIPPHDKFTEEHINSKNQNEKECTDDNHNKNNSSLIDRLRIF